MLKRFIPLLIPITLLSVTLVASAFRDEGRHGTALQKETCDQCTTRNREICAHEKKACELRAKAADVTLRRRCGSNEDCLVAAMEAFDEELLACDEEEDDCSVGASGKCIQCKSEPAAQAEPCDACLSRHETICEHRESAAKARNRAEYHIGLQRCGPDKKDCIRLIEQAYDDGAMAALLEAQACSLAATDGCGRCRYIEKNGQRRTGTGR